MRRRSALAGIACLAAALALSAGEARASGSDPGARPDSAAWIPPEADDLDGPDRLLDHDALRGSGLRGDWRGGRFGVRRAWVRAAARWAGSPVVAELAWLARQESTPWSTALLEVGAGRVQVAAGAVVARRAPVLFGDAMGLSRPLRAPRPPRLEAPTFEPPRGASSLAIRGAAARAAVGAASAWGLAGRDRSGSALAAGGLALDEGDWGAAASGGIRSSSGSAGTAEEELRAASLGARIGSGEGRLSGELLLSPSRGPAVLLETAGRSGPVRAAARWRRKPGETRPVAGELLLETGFMRTRTRLTWSSWSVRAPSDDGRLELEVVTRRGAFGPARVRAGGRPNGERYVIADLEIARERGRSFTLLASRREKRRAGAVSAGSTWGGRLDWSARGRTGATFFLQAARADAGSGASAWAQALAPSGEEALVARGRSGVVVTGRAWLKAGPLEVEALLSDAGGDGTDRPAQGSLRVEWSREGR